MDTNHSRATFRPYRKFPRFSVIPDCISKHQGISPLGKLVYGFLVRCSGKDGDAFPSIETIGEAVGVSTRQARRAVSELRELDLIRTVKRTNHSGQTSNLFLFVWHDWMDDGRTDMSATGRTDLSDIKEQSEETSGNTVFEPLPTVAPRPQAADAPRCSLRSIIQQRSGHTITEGQIDAIIVRATVRTGRAVNASECAAVASVLPLPSGRAQAIQSAAWWVSAIPNAFAETRAAAENYRPEDFMASPAAEEPSGRWAELMDEVCPVN